MPDAFDAVHGFPHYPGPATYLHASDTLRGWEFNGWKPESMSWKTGCYIHTGLSGPLVTVSGPQADAFMAFICTNNLSNLPQGTMRHAVMCNEAGLIGGHGILQRYDSGLWKFFAGGPWPLIMAAKYKFDIAIAFDEQIYLTQIAGPKSLEALQRASGEDLSDIGFLRYRNTTIAGKTVEVGRIGMSGNLAYEVRGPLGEGAAVYDAIYAANREIGIERLGWRTYLVNHVEGGFPQATWSFGSVMIEDPVWLSMVPPDHWSIAWHRSGSIDHGDLRARYRTPFELNWDRSVSFNHDFAGRTPLEKEAKAPRRRTVTLRWNAEDVIDIYASLFRPGEEYKTMELPTTPTYKEGFLLHADRVLADGREVGVSSANAYSYYFRQMLSMGCIDTALTAPGTELIVEWGDHGRRIKPVRVAVERFPYLSEGRNSEV